MTNITHTIRNARRLAAAAVAALALTACSSVDCPLNNRVYASFRLAGTVAALADTLTVATPRTADNAGEDTVLLNRLTGADSLSLPMSYQRDEDTFYFTLVEVGTRRTTVDTVWVAKQNEMHFESVDCAPAVFHTITGVRFTQHAIDDIQINNNKVTYNDAKAHFLIYFSADREQ